MTLKRKRVVEIMDRFAKQRILVTGDLMLDRYIYGQVSRISPEAPVPVVRVKREVSMPGGASNVARNIVALGGGAVVAGFIGQDGPGKTLSDLLKSGGVGTDGLMMLDDRATTVKTRIIAEHQQVVRVDWDNVEEYTPEVMQEFVVRLSEQVRHSTGVIIEDYGKGVVVQPVVDEVIREGRQCGVPTGMDPKDNHELDVEGVSVITPNRAEAFSAVNLVDNKPGPDPLQDERLLRVGAGLLEKWKPELLMLTLGSLGLMLVAEGRANRHIPTRAREVFDVSGAGDTVIATCLLAMAAGATHEEAAELANYAAGIVVGKLGTATTSCEELLACFV